MNEQQPYEKHLSDRLQKLNPSGDANSNWPQMKALLDREMPVGGNGGNKNRWWIYSLIAILLITATWFGSSLLSNDKNESANVAATTSTSKEDNKDLGVSGNNDAQKNNDESTSNESAIATNKNDNKKSKPDNVSAENSKASGIAASSTTEAKEDIIKPTSNNVTDKESLKIKKGIVEKNNSTGNSVAVKNNVVPNDKKYKGNKNGRNNQGQQVAYVPVVSGKNKQGVANSGKTGTNSIESNNQKTTDNSVEENTANASVVRQEISSPEMVGIDYPDSLQTDYATQSQLVTVKTRSRFKSNTNRVKGLKNRTVGTGDNKNFVVGLSLPMAFPLGDQTPIAYNHNAGPNTVSDYLPAPHMQYHFNQQSYFQAELQVLSPQYIQPALVYEKSYVQTGGTSNYRYITNSVYAKKLYYFSLPVGVHYSPFKNFYLGSGLQFSSLLSGVAQYESRGYNSLGPAAADTLFSSSVQKFKNDSISSQLSNNEFRVMLDANYYWHRFTVGFRYNQALSNFVSVQVNSFSPLYTDKNKSIQFYLRYNIWEDMKKKKKTGAVAGR